MGQGFQRIGGVRAQDWGKMFDTISVCLSKGLGPVGSVLLGTKAEIKQARKVRKLWWWHASGRVLAAGIYTLGHHIDRLKETFRAGNWAQCC